MYINAYGGDLTCVMWWSRGLAVWVHGKMTMHMAIYRCLVAGCCSNSVVRHAFSNLEHVVSIGRPGIAHGGSSSGTS